MKWNEDTGDNGERHSNAFIHISTRIYTPEPIQDVDTNSGNVMPTIDS